MAEPPATTLEQTGVSGSDGLLATKLYLPHPPPGLVGRPRLEEGLARGLMLVCAPAGFGKTSLLAALSLRGQADVAGFVAAFSGSHRYVLDYLTEEVLDRQPDQVRAGLRFQHRRMAGGRPAHHDRLGLPRP
jgi:ATP/maltotriose-dependent transcriptional regulator MalT